MCDNTSVQVKHQKCPCAAGGGTTADTLPERTADACPEEMAPGRQDTFTFLISANIQIYLHTRGDHLFRTEGEKMNLNVAYYLDEKVFLFVFVCFLFLLR